jgi:Flp pilus assembly protein protease CpaA
VAEIAKIIATAWLVTVAVWDRLRGRIPNALVAPVAAGALGWQIYRAARDHTWGSLAVVLLVWAALYAIWRLGVFGAGDAKLLMALIALFPTLTFLLLWAVVVVVVCAPRLLLHKTKTESLDANTRARSRFPGKLFPLPTQADLRAGASPDAWVFCLAGILYLWWLV